MSQELDHLINGLYMTADILEFCREKVYLTPALILIYAEIDHMAWLDRPDTHDDVKSEDFENWVDEFLLPGSGLPCSSGDLYAARCGLLHSQTAESKRSRKGSARPIHYYTRDTDPSAIKLYGSLAPDAISVEFEAIVDAFRNAIHRFGTAVASDAGRRTLVLERAKKTLVTISAAEAVK